MNRLRLRLLLVKERFKIPARTPIHCRILMHKNAREKANLGHLTDEQARSVIGFLVRDINRVKAGLRYAYTTLPMERPIEQPPTLGMHQIPFEPKYVLGMLAQACFAVAVDGSQGPLAKDCEIVVAEDRTLISTGNRYRSQAHKSASGFSDIGAQPGEVFRVEPCISTAADEPMLEVADILAYMCSHARGRGPTTGFFTEQLERILIRTWSDVRLDFDQGPWQS